MAELFKYLNILYRRRYIFVFTTIIVLVLTTLVVETLPKKFQADSTFFIEKNIINSLIKGLAVTPDMKDRIRIMKHAILSRAIISKVLAKMNVDITIQDEVKYQALLTDLKARTNLLVKKNDIFIISIVDKDPVFAQKFINTLVSTYVEEKISAKRDEAFGATRFLDEQLVVLKEKLEEAENAIIDYKRKHGILFLPEDESILIQIQKFETEIEMIALAIDTLNAKKTSLKEQLASLQPEITLFSETQIFDKVFQREEELALKRLTYTDLHPKILKLKTEIEELKLQRETLTEKPREGVKTTSLNPLYQDVSERLLDVESELTALEKREERFKILIDRKKKGMKNSPEERKELARLGQERESIRKMYEILLVRLEQSEMSRQMEIGDKTTTFRILDPAVLPTVPVFPKPLKMLLLTLAAGLGAGFGAALLREVVDTSVKGVQELEGYGIAVLGVIPEIIAPGTAMKTRKKDIILACSLVILLTGVVSIFAIQIIGKVI
jgi:polysaccharide chain length determinant protein (PEP-CTERM system associated)